MGIPGLTRFVNSIENLWTSIVLHDTKIVIDGSSLRYYLYEGLDCRCGGQYDEFYQAVVSFFDALNSSCVECFVVFDGANDPRNKKLDTIKQRALNSIEKANKLTESADSSFLLPLLAKYVFLQALRDRGIKFAICDSEADTEIASLAAAWNCPVLSNDSDFFIFDIQAGYIPLSFLDMDRLTGRIFYRRELASHHQFCAELTPLFASLAGNDYVSSDTLAVFHQAVSPTQVASKREVFESIANMLSELPSSYTQEEALKFALRLIPSGREDKKRIDELKQAVELSLQEYNIKESNLLGYFERDAICSSLRTQNGHQIEQWVLQLFRAGQFSTKCMNSLTTGKFVLRVQVENCREKSANCSSLRLRQFLYSILNDPGENEDERNIMTFHEWDREGMTVKETNVAPYVEGVVPSLSLVPSLDAKERFKFLLLGLNADTPDIRLLPEKFKLIAASLRYLISHAQPAVKMNHLVALLCCCVTSTLEEDLTEEKGKRIQRKRSPQPFDLQAAHSFCQWQCVLRDAIHLNYTLCEPVPTPCIHKTFNGQMAHTLQQELHQGRTPEELLPSFRQFPVYYKLYTAVTTDLSDKMVPQENKGGKKTDRKTKRSPVKKNLKSGEARWENSFAVLCDLGEQE